MIEPFFFGPRNAFGLYHPSATGAAQRLVVICPSLFDEHRRCYKVLADFGVGCAAEGLDVLRIDYPGTAEAYGDITEQTVNNWIEDINLSIEEGIALSGATEVYLVGVRVGATLAAQSLHSNIKKYVFWDPIINGGEFVRVIENANAESDKSHKKLILLSNKRKKYESYRCFNTSDELLADLKSLSLSGLVREHPEKLAIVSTSKARPKQFKDLDFTYSGYTYSWPIKHQGLLTPKPAIRALLEKVTQ